MNTEASEALAYWIARNEPELWRALLEKAAQRGQLGGISDFFRTVGSSIGGAVKSVGSYLKSSDGMKTLTELGGVYLTTRMQEKALETQSLLAQANFPPAPIQNVQAPGGVVVPVYTPLNRPLDASLLAQLQPSFLERYGASILIGVGIALAFALLVRSTR